jgi:molybdate transport system substrate-binding protein
LGPLPPEIQTLTTFSAALSATSAAAEVARTLLEFMGAPERAVLKQQHGMGAAE